MPSIHEVYHSEQARSERHIVSISGGKDSSALAIYMKENYPDLPVEYVFCDTQSELKETYAYLDRLEEYLGKEIHRVNAFEALGLPNRRDKTPFDLFLDELYSGYLPSPRSRWCTRELKIKPYEWYVGDATAYSYIGIRADENREGYTQNKKPVLSGKPNIIPVYPFKDDDLRLEDINEILEDSGVGLPSYYKWRSRSGCYFCFYQQIGEWQGLKENHPDLFEKAKQYESVESSGKFTWVDGKTLDDVANAPRKSIIDAEQSAGCAICHL